MTRLLWPTVLVLSAGLCFAQDNTQGLSFEVKAAPGARWQLDYEESYRRELTVGAGKPRTTENRGRFKADLALTKQGQTITFVEASVQRLGVTHEGRDLKGSIPLKKGLSLDKTEPPAPAQLVSWLEALFNDGPPEPLAPALRPSGQALAPGTSWAIPAEALFPKRAPKGYQGTGRIVSLTRQRLSFAIDITAQPEQLGELRFKRGAQYRLTVKGELNRQDPRRPYRVVTLSVLKGELEVEGLAGGKQSAQLLEKRERRLQRRLK